MFGLIEVSIIILNSEQQLIGGEGSRIERIGIIVTSEILCLNKKQKKQKGQIEKNRLQRTQNEN